jgi:hypothetical protein
MDPVTVAIGAALAAGVMKVGQSAFDDAYQALKDTLVRKFGGQSEIAKAVDGLEARPDSAGRATTLQEEVAAAKADQDPDILTAAHALLDQVKAQPGGQQSIQNVYGNQNAVTQGGGTATVHNYGANTTPSAD